ncbi:MAG TPA: ABC transporter permease subunit [Candidatus Saccharimonadales bacterium]|nr:ABC transporter permease subunit [Candidatus Saccharimonadales bacterium]
MSVADPTADALPVEPKQDVVPTIGAPVGGGGWKSHLGSLLFLLPGALWLLIIVVYPFIATIVRSLFDGSGTRFIALGNYKAIFSTTDIIVSLKNNVVWVVVFPFLVTFFGLVFAVLTERIRWGTAFKTIVFMPLVFSATAAGLTWASIFFNDPHTGVVNAAVQGVANGVNPPGLYPVDTSAGESVGALAATGVESGPGGTLQSKSTVTAGGTIELGLTGISPAVLQTNHATTAQVPSSSSGAITGLVWRDFSPSHPTARGQVFPDEDGIAGMHVALLSADGSVGATTTTASDGSFSFAGVGSSIYRIQITANNFQAGFNGIFFLGTQSLTPTGSLNPTLQAVLSLPIVDIAMIIAYLWIWAGFAMVVIGAGLAALNREVLEAAQIDGASEWQTLRRVTVPMLRPVLVVVFVTMLINVLKIFDIILNMATPSSQSGASTIALDIYNNFASNNGQGLAAALAVILFILVVPAMLMNLKRIRG